MKKQVFASVLALLIMGCSESGSQANAESESVPADSAQPASESLKQEKPVGEFTKNASTMPINGEYTLWDDSENTLSIFLTPTPLTSEEKTKLEGGEPDFFVFSDKESPDNSQWQWYPYVVAEIRFKSGEISRENAQSIYIKAYGIEKQNHTDNLNLRPGDAGQFHSIGFSGEDLSINYSGESSIMDNNYHWRIER